MTLKMPVVAPMLSAIESTAAAENCGTLQNWRNATRESWISPALIAETSLTRLGRVHLVSVQIGDVGVLLKGGFKISWSNRSKILKKSCTSDSRRMLRAGLREMSSTLRQCEAPGFQKRQYQVTQLSSSRLQKSPAACGF